MRLISLHNTLRGDRHFCLSLHQLTCGSTVAIEGRDICNVCLPPSCSQTGNHKLIKLLRWSKLTSCQRIFSALPGSGTSQFATLPLKVADFKATSQHFSCRLALPIFHLPPSMQFGLHVLTQNRILKSKYKYSANIYVMNWLVRVCTASKMHNILQTTNMSSCRSVQSEFACDCHADTRSLATDPRTRRLLVPSCSPAAGERNTAMTLPVVLNYQGHWSTSTLYSCHVLPHTWCVQMCAVH